jgi:o-succinylbenzoate---CoA ligase
MRHDDRGIWDNGNVDRGRGKRAPTDVMTPWEYVQNHTGNYLPDNPALQSVTQQYTQTLSNLPPGQTIVLAEPDPIKFLACWIAAASTPHRLVLANPDWQSHEWQQLYALVQPDIVIGTAPAQDQIQPNPKPIDQLPTQVILIPTGGTSGQLKFAIHTWATLTAAIEGLQQYFQIPQINSCCVLPLYHVSGLMQAVRSLVTGGQLTLHPWKSLESGRFPAIQPHSFLSLVPTQLLKLLDRDLPEMVEFLQTFEAIFLGGAPAWDSLLDRARQLNLPIAPTYGMTETAGQIATLKPVDFLAGHTGCGQVLPHAQITIANSLLQVTARSMMLGYFPAQPFQLDDRGHFDDRRSLHLTGRQSDKIISGGENIFPAEVEAAIRATGYVSDVCVIGIPDDRWGEVVAAAIVTDHALSDIQQALAAQIVTYKHPKHWRIVPTLPRTAQGKLTKSRIKSWFSPADPQGSAILQM